MTYIIKLNFLHFKRNILYSDFRGLRSNYTKIMVAIFTKFGTTMHHTAGHISGKFDIFQFENAIRDILLTLVSYDCFTQRARKSFRTKAFAFVVSQSTVLTAWQRGIAVVYRRQMFILFSNNNVYCQFRLWFNKIPITWCWSLPAIWPLFEIMK